MWPSVKTVEHFFHSRVQLVSCDKMSLVGEEVAVLTLNLYVISFDFLIDCF